LGDGEGNDRNGNNYELVVLDAAEADYSRLENQDIAD
jgi:hypothetical protein